MKFKGYLLKRKIEDLLMLPLIKAGATKRPDTKSEEYDIYFFFPFYHTGGAEQVHLQIAKLFGGTHNCIIFFTRKSVDERYLQEFRNTGCEIVDISQHTNNKLKYHENIKWRGKLANMINQQGKKPVVFNGQSNFGYKISPWIRKDIRQVELIHSFNSFSWIRLPFLPFITASVMISKRRIEEHLQQYKKLNIPKAYADRIHFIANAIDLPLQECSKTYDGTLKILFVGRGTPEKRPELFVNIAREAHRMGIAAAFTLVGDMETSILNGLPENLQVMGNINDQEKLHQIYCSHHLLIIPSSTEGFPLVLMEAMARGCAVMATPVGDIPYHINAENGFLFSSIDERAVINETIHWLQQLTYEKLQQLATTTSVYAAKNFGIQNFNQQYKAILQL